MSGHGWVHPNANGVKARCGGPAVCSQCAGELLAQTPWQEEIAREADRRLTAELDHRARALLDDPTVVERIAEAAAQLVTREVRTATVIRPGDHVLLTTIEPFAQRDLPGMVAQLRERFPGVEFTFVAGVTDIAVQHPPEEP